MGKWQDFLDAGTPAAGASRPTNPRSGRNGQLAVGAAVAVLVAALGGAAIIVLPLGADDEAEISQVVEDYYWAAARGDGEAACAFVADSEKILGNDACVESVGRNPTLMSDKELTQMERAQVDRVRLEDDEAFAFLADIDANVELERAASGWQITRDPLGAH